MVAFSTSTPELSHTCAGVREHSVRHFGSQCEAKSGSMGSGEGLGGFGAQPGQVQQSSEKVPEKAWEAFIQNQLARFKIGGRGLK